MKRKFLILCTLCAFLFSAGPVSAQEEVMTLTGQGLKTYTFNSSLTQDETSVHVKTRNPNSGFSFAGNWDLTSYNKLSFAVTNLNEKSMLHVYVQVQDKAQKIGKLRAVQKKGTMSYCVTLDPGEHRKVEIDLPAPLPYPDVSKKFKRMRYSPYMYALEMNGYDVDWAAVTRVKFIATQGNKYQEFVISDVNFHAGERALPADAPWLAMSAEEFFPFIDKYGQFKHNDWKDKIHSDEDLAKAKEFEEKDLAANPGPEDRTKFGGWKNGPRYDATGHFRVEKIDGKWWFIDPEGYLWWSHGVVRVTPSSAVTPLDGRRDYFEYLPQSGDEFSKFYHTHDVLLKPYYTARKIKSTYDFSSANLYRKYGEDYKQIFADLAHRRLMSWGLNTIANSSDKDICHMDKTPYIERIEINESPVLHGVTGGWWKVRDPWDPEFANEIRRKLTECKAQLDDPWCVGYFVDNEMAWKGPSYLASCVVKAPAEEEAKQAMTDFFKKKYKKVKKLNAVWGTTFASWDEFLNNNAKAPKNAKEDLVEFNEQIIHKYFSTIRTIFKEIAPHKLYMGCRFAGSNKQLVEIGSQYCDLMSWNSYRMDLDDFLKHTYPFLDKPVIIGEFHFGAYDRGKFHPTLQRVMDQEQRGRAYYNYVKSALEHPLVVGTHWHQFADQATTGRFDGENFQVGFTDMCDTPYYETIEKIREIGYQLYQVRANAKK